MNKEDLLKFGLTDEQSEKVAEAFNSEIQSLKIDYAVCEALVKAGAKNVVAAKALIDFSSISIKDDKIIGIDEQIDELVKNKDSSFLFNRKNKDFKNAAPEESRDGISEKNFKNMTYTEMCKYLEQE